MTRDHFGQAVQRVDRDAQFALNELKRHPDYPAIQLRALEESESLFKSVGSQLPKPALPSQERLDCAIKSMDIWAGAYTGLIANLADQEKYLKVLAGLRVHAWRLYIGMTGIEPLPHNQAWVAIRDRSAHWQKESLRKLLPPEAPLDSNKVIPSEEPSQTVGGDASRRSAGLPDAAELSAATSPANFQDLAGKMSVDSAHRGFWLTVEIFPSASSFVPEKLGWAVEDIVDEHEVSIRKAVIEALSALRSSRQDQSPSTLIFDAVAEMGTELFNEALDRLAWIDDNNPPDTYDDAADALYQDAVDFVRRKYKSLASEIPGLSPDCEPARLDALRTDWLQIREEAKQEVHELSKQVREAPNRDTGAAAQSSTEPTVQAEPDDFVEPRNIVPSANDVDPVAPARRAALLEFKTKGRRLGIKITDPMVARAANPKWNDRTMVTWWKRNDDRCKLSHDRMIRALLAKDPATIWQPGGDTMKHATA